MKARLKAAVVLVAILVGTQAGSSQEPSQPYRGLEAIREDARAKRFFVRAEDKDLARAEFQGWLDTIGSYIGHRRKDWGRDWSLSFFTDPRFAHYKDEIDMKKDGAGWAAAYIGEYDRRSGTMTLYPLDPKKMKRYHAVPRLP